MCGIVGYISNNNILNSLLDSLKEMEYRGYDSSGVAIITSDNSVLYKEVGKLQNLVKVTSKFTYNNYAIGIGHTRWATHGKVTKLNAHPHNGKHSFMVHNGIIENYTALKNELIKKNIIFQSDTDSEVIVHLFEDFLIKHGNPLKALKYTISKLEGAFAFLLISSNFKDEIFFAKRNSPLIIGYSDNEVQIVSSSSAFNNSISKAYYVNNNEYGYIKLNMLEVFNKDKKVSPKFESFYPAHYKANKDKFNYFMEKEILEQHVVLKNTIKDKILDNQVSFEELPQDFFNNINRILFCGCGTSYHAGLVASYLLEKHTNIIGSAQIASEFTYRNPLLKNDDLVILISQSGETADTLSVLKLCKLKNIKTLVISNVENSSLVRGSISILTKIGIEKSVATTKAFSAQVLIMWLLIIYISKINNPNKNISKDIVSVHEAIKACKVDSILNNTIVELVRSLDNNYRYLFLGRDVFYPLALEGALKLKEITYISAEGYAAGEMKHGPIAMADSNLCTIALNPVNLLYDKTQSNIIEIASRNSKVVNISAKNFNKELIFIKSIETSFYMVEFFRTLVILQLLAMHTAIKLGKDVDMPRNLAKSVTVE